MNSRWIAVGLITCFSCVLTAGLLLGRGSDLRPSAEVHAIHAELELECESCHADAAGSSSGLDELRPGHEQCADCHDVDEAEECGTCHSSTEPAGYPEKEPKVELFPHALHLEKGMTCTECHGAAENPVLPEKQLCRTCHATASGLTDCSLCHGPSEELVPASHVPQWLAFHPVEGGWDQAECATCHTQSDCQDCHSGDNVRPRSHPLEFVFNHALEARSGEADCMICHESAEFCSSCHRAERVLPQNHSRVDWLSGRRGGRHAEEARFDLESCIACHDEGADAPVCAQCHGR